MYTRISRYVSKEDKNLLIGIISEMRDTKEVQELCSDIFLEKGERFNNNEQVFQALVMNIADFNVAEEHICLAIEALKSDPVATNNAILRAFESAASCDYHYKYEKEWN